MEVRVGALVTAIGSALNNALDISEEESNVTKPKMVTVLPGAAVAFDYCEDGGMAWSRLVAVEPIETQVGRQCVVEYDITVEVAILRCAPMIHEDETLPTAEEQLAASMLQFHDLGLMHDVLACTVVPATFENYRIGTYAPVGPEGGCVGGSWTATWRTS